MDPAGKLFGNSRLLEAIGRGRNELLREGIDTLLEEIARWQGGGRPQDDISILAIEVAAAPTPGAPSIKAPTPPDAVPEVAPVLAQLS
jgi:hypothetical protein